MDVSKLLNVLEDINNSDETKSDLIATLIQNIASNLTTEITTTVEKIRNEFNNSSINDYNSSNLEILSKIGANKFIGKLGLIEFEKVLTANTYNTQKTVENLQKYLTERKDFAELVSKTEENLTTLKFKSYYHVNDKFEVGLLMPTEYTNKKIKTITKELNHWDKVFKTLKELSGENPEDTELNFVSNGSLQFFIDNPAQSATCLAIAIERIVKVYKNILEIRTTREKLKELGINTAEQKSIEKQEKEIFTKEMDKISSEIIKEFASKSIENERLNELKIAMNGHVRYIAKCIDGGMTIEITPPIMTGLNTEKETEENKEEIKQIKTNYDKTLKQVEIVQKSMETLKSIGSIGMDIIGFLGEGDKSE